MKLSRKDFAVKYGLSQGNCFNYINRGKIFEENGKIDDKNPINQAFLNKRKLIPERKGKKSKVRVPSLPDPEKVQKRNNLLDLELEKKKAEIDYKNQQSKMAELKQNRMLGEYLPLHLAKHLFTLHIKNLQMSYKDAIDKMIVDMAATLKGSQNDIAHLRRKMNDALNKCVDRAVETSERDIDAAHDSSKATG